MTNKLSLAKSAANIIVGSSVSKVINDVIKNNTDVETTADQAKVAIGSVVLGCMVADHAKTYVHKPIEAVADWFESRKATETN